MRRYPLRRQMEQLQLRTLYPSSSGGESVRENLMVPQWQLASYVFDGLGASSDDIFFFKMDPCFYDFGFFFFFLSRGRFSLNEWLVS